MSQYFHELDYPHLEYNLETCAELPGWKLRGPVPDLQKPYFVCIGATQVFGRFCKQPFPTLLSDALGLPVLNLGRGGHGPQTLHDESTLAVINRAEFAVVQMVSARIGSNSAFQNSENGRGQGVRIADGKEMSFTDFIEDKIRHAPYEEVVQLVEETRDSWVQIYRDLLKAIKVPKVLHWFSTVLPFREDDFSDRYVLFDRFPQLVNWAMIDRIRGACDAYVETICRLGLPQPLWESEQHVNGAVLRGGRLYNMYYPSPEMHQAAARDLLPACRQIADRLNQGIVTPYKPLVISATPLDARFAQRLLGGGVASFSYRQLLADRGLLPLLASGNPRVLHLRRRNLIEGAGLQGANGDNAAAVLDPSDLAGFVQSVVEAEEHVAQSCLDGQVMEVFMEDLKADPSAHAARIAAHLHRPEVDQAALENALNEVPGSPIEQGRDRLDPVLEHLVQQFASLRQ